MIVSDIEGMELPGGLYLERDLEFGYFRVMPRPSERELAEYYKNQYRPPVRLHDPEGRADLVCRLHPQPGRVLDVGCGQGDLLEVFLKRGWDAMGVEPGTQDARAARGKGIRVIENLLTGEIADELGPFDAVLLVHVLEHLPQPQEMVRLVHRLLVPGGVFYCEVPNDFNVLQEVAVESCGLMRWWVVYPDHLNYFSIESLSAFIQANGFDACLRTTDFPMELFLLWGNTYIGNSEIGREMHRKRCAFERAMREAGRGELLSELYRKLAEIGIGRQAIVCARKI